VIQHDTSTRLIHQEYSIFAVSGAHAWFRAQCITIPLACVEDIINNTHTPRVCYVYTARVHLISFRRVVCVSLCLSAEHLSCIRLVARVVWPRGRGGFSATTELASPLRTIIRSPFLIAHTHSTHAYIASTSRTYSTHAQHASTARKRGTHAHHASTPQRSWQRAWSRVEECASYQSVQSRVRACLSDSLSLEGFYHITHPIR
jgi:hypothetical protein